MSSDVSHILKGISRYEIHMQEQIVEAFRVFDEDGNGKIDKKYVSIIARILGRVPRTTELHRFVKKVQDPDDFVKLETLLPALTDVLLKDTWRPVPKGVLLEAFEFLDSNKNGLLDPQYMEKLLTHYADKLNEEEVKQFLEFATDPTRKVIDYEKVYEKMAVPETVDVLEENRKLLSEFKK